MLRALANARVKVAVASGIALSAYLLNNHQPIHAQADEHIFVINGFYMSMRAVFTTPPAKICWYSVEWPASSLSWENFRGKVLGGTDPKEAEPGSARREILGE